jgi:O-antigen/teichoic acid export membrane protein
MSRPILSAEFFKLNVPVRRISFHPALRDLGFVGSSGFLTAIAAMLVIAVVGKAFGPALLGEYLLIRRMAAWLQFAVQIPSGVALPRYVAASPDSPESPKVSYFISALLTACSIGLLLCFVLFIWRDRLSALVFGSSTLSYLVIPLGIFLLGLAVHGAVYGYFQGILRMGWASALQICNLGIVPVLCAVLLRGYHSVSMIVNTIGVAMIVCACVFVVPVVRKRDFLVSRELLKKHGLELFSFGAARVSGEFGLQALLSLPAVIAARFFPISSVAFLLLAGSFLTAAAAATMPLGIILLSRVSRSIAEVGANQLQTRVSYFVSALLELSVFVGLQMIVFADAIVRLWVGPGFLDGIRIIQITIIAVPFYFVYAGLRGIVDAAAIKAYNTRSVYIACAVFFVSVILGTILVPRSHLLEGLAAAGVLGMMVLAGCTLWTVGHLFEMKIGWRGLLPGLAIGVLFGGVSFAFHATLGNQAGAISLLIYETVLALLYILLLMLINAPWVLFLRSVMVTYAAPKEQTSD